MSDKVKVLVVGCGNMGISHARAYHQLDGFEIVGLVSRGASKEKLNAEFDNAYALFDNYDDALARSGATAVSINTYPDTHYEYAMKGLNAGCHLFMEKPIAETVAQAVEVVELAKKVGKKVVVGYILRHHPAWAKFTEIAQTLGKPLVMRMNLNQQSHGRMWDVHRNLMNSMSPIVDCGVHYVDVMCQMTRTKPVAVHAMGARLSEELNDGMYNYGMLQVKFEDGSCGWYEAGWGPMMSETAFFVKDVVGPKGSATIVKKLEDEEEAASDNVDSHTKTNQILVHRSELDENNEFVHADERIDTRDEPDHDGLCLREQIYFLAAIQDDVDLTDHLDDAINSLRIVLAADESVRSGEIVRL